MYREWVEAGPSQVDARARTMSYAPGNDFIASSGSGTGELSCGPRM
jgi:hypothetical protein